MGIARGRLPGSLHLVVATLTFCRPVVGAGYAPGYKGNSSSKKGKSKTEVFLSQNRASLEFWEPKSLSLLKLPAGLSTCWWAQLWPLIMWRHNADPEQTGGDLPFLPLAAVAWCWPSWLAFLGGEDGTIFLDTQVPSSRRPSPFPQNHQ